MFRSSQEWLGPSISTRTSAVIRKHDEVSYYITTLYSKVSDTWYMTIGWLVVNNIDP